MYIIECLIRRHPLLLILEVKPLPCSARAHPIASERNRYEDMDLSPYIVITLISVSGVESERKDRGNTGLVSRTPCMAFKRTLQGDAKSRI